MDGNECLCFVGSKNWAMDRKKDLVKRAFEFGVRNTANRRTISQEFQPLVSKLSHLSLVHA